MFKFPNWLKPDYLERYTLFISIKKIIEKYYFEGRLLDIGCGNKPYRNLFKKCTYIGIDFRDFSKNKYFCQGEPDLFFPPNYKNDFLLTNIKTSSFDIIVSFQVLEHHKKPRIFFKECNRILKTNGKLMLTVPFVWELHEQPNDYYRFTEYAIRSLCEEYNFKIITTKKRGGVFSVVNQILSNHFFNTNSKITKIIALPIILTQTFSYSLDNIFKNHRIFLGYTFLAKKIK